MTDFPLAVGDGVKRDQSIFYCVAHDTRGVFAAFYFIDLGFEHLAVDQDASIRGREVLVAPLVNRPRRFPGHGEISRVRLE